MMPQRKKPISMIKKCRSLSASDKDWKMIGVKAEKRGESNSEYLIGLAEKDNENGTQI
jgi:hypothetical protein